MATYTREQLIALVETYANRYGIKPAIAVAQIRRESDNFRPDVVYGPYVAAAGERGMSQFTPGTWARFGSGPHTNAYDPDQALTAWGKYMTYLLNLFGWDYSKTLISYNGGEGHVLDPGRFKPPSAAAQRYAREILAQAGAGAGPGADAESGDDGPSLMTWLAIGGAIAVAWVLLDD